MTTKGANIGTGNIISGYVRPGLKELTKAEFEAAQKQKDCKQLSLNMWSFEISKNPRVKGAYITPVMVRRLGKYYLTIISTDKNGLVPQLTMAERLMDVESGDRGGHMRNVMIDCSVDALKVVSETDKAKVYYWYIYPNETDVKYIDDSHTKLVEILKSGKNGTGRSSRILITGGTAAQRDAIAKSLSENFTVREKYLINNCLIEIVSDSKPFAGCFSGQSDSKGNPIGTPRIQITESHTAEADVVVHEAIHALREFDVKRDTKLRAVKHYSGKDADLEESLTEAETTGRETPFKRGDNYKAGYYHYLKIPKVNPSEINIAWSEVRPGGTSIYGENKTEYPYYIGQTPDKRKYLITRNRVDGKWIVLDEYKNTLATLSGVEACKRYVDTNYRIKNRGENKGSAEMVIEDRITITGAKDNSQKGKRVQKSLLLHYPMTNIAKLKLKGSAEAIDTFYEVGNRKQGIDGAASTGAAKTRIHMYDPAATMDLDRRQDRVLDSETSERIIQYQDEKPVTVCEGETPPAASMGITRSRDPKFRSKPPRNFDPERRNKKTSRKPSRLGPYFHRGGRLSKHRC